MSRPDGTCIRSVRYDASNVDNKKGNNKNSVIYHTIITITDGEVVLVENRKDLDDERINPLVKPMIKEIFELDGVRSLRLEKYFFEVDAFMAVDWIKVNLHQQIAMIIVDHLFENGKGTVDLLRRDCGF